MPRTIKINSKPTAKRAAKLPMPAATPAAHPATNVPAEAPAATAGRSADTATVNSKPDATLRAKRTAAVAKPADAKPNGKAKPAADKPATERFHEIPRDKLTYAGPSPVLRFGAKLTAINPHKSFGPPTERDESFLRDMRARYAGKPFPRLNTDAGCVNRQIFYGNLAIVSGELTSPHLQLQITKRGLGLKL